MPEFKLKEKMMETLHDAPSAGTQVFSKPIGRLGRGFDGRALRTMPFSMAENAELVSRTSRSMSFWSDYYGLFLFHHRYGRVSPWTSLQDCRQCRAEIIFVVVDRLTKFAHFYAIATDWLTSWVAELFFREVFRLHSLPQTIVSDRGSKFLNTFWQELFKFVSTELTPSMSYHPQTDRQIEKVNKWVEGYLQNYVAGQQRAWVKWLYLGECFKIVRNLLQLHSEHTYMKL